MIIEDAMLFFASCVGIFGGIYGAYIYRPRFDLHGYLGSKLLLGALLIGPATTVAISLRYGLARGIFHLGLYCLILGTGIFICNRLVSDQQ